MKNTLRRLSKEELNDIRLRRRMAELLRSDWTLGVQVRRKQRTHAVVPFSSDREIQSSQVARNHVTQDV
jgi:hypothetical protein